MPRAFLSLTAVAGHYGLQNLQLADNSWRECTRPLSPDRRVYGEVEHRIQVTANTHLALQTASPHCQHSPLEFFQSFYQTACEYDRRRLRGRRALQRLVRGALQT